MDLRAQRLTPLPRTVTASLLDALRQRILSGELAPGARLRQDELASSYGVSRIPIREALIQLETEGLVTSHPHRGAEVKPMSAAEAAEIFGLRVGLEPEATIAGAAAANATERTAAANALFELNDATRSHAPQLTVGQLNWAFHRSLYLPATKPHTTAILDRLHVLSMRYIAHHLRDSGRLEKAVEDHQAIFDAWHARSPSLKALLTVHIAEAGLNLERVLA